MPPRWPRSWLLLISTCIRTDSTPPPSRSPICWPFSAFRRSGGWLFPSSCRWSRRLTYNYFFLPPVGTFMIADPQNWVALVTFLATSVLASDLSTRARNQAAEANRRRHEVERLYRFSQRLLSAGNPIELLNAIPRQIVDTFEVGAAALFLIGQAKSIPFRDESAAARCGLFEGNRRAGRAANRRRAQRLLCPASPGLAHSRQRGHFGTGAFARVAGGAWAR